MNGRFGRAVSAFLLVAATVLLTHCGGGEPPGADICPEDVPATCVSPFASYQRDVRPVLDRYCQACHTAGGVAEIHPFDSHAQVAANQVGIVYQLRDCLMPPANYPQPTLAERQALLSWVICGAVED